MDRGIHNTFTMVCEREREREREGGREGDWKGEGESMKEERKTGRERKIEGEREIECVCLTECTGGRWFVKSWNLNISRLLCT